MKKRITAVAIAGIAATALAVTPAQANTGSVTSSEWYKVTAGMTKTKAQSVMGATGAHVTSITINNPNGTRTLKEAIAYTPASSLAGTKPTITYAEVVSPSWQVLVPWYVQSKFLA